MSQENPEKQDLDLESKEPETETQSTATKDGELDDGRISGDENKIKEDLKETEKERVTPASPKSRPQSNARSDKGEGRDGRTSSSPDRQSGVTTDGRPKSSTSVVEGPSEVKIKKKGKKGELNLEGHEVTFNITISIAVPTVEEDIPQIEDDEQPDIQDLVKKKKRVFEAPRAQNYYHLEYVLVPNADELAKTDVVTYGMGAKIYIERSDPFVKKTWHDGEVTWIAWSQKHKLFVTKDVLLKMYNHTLQLRIWDTKDKVGTRAKFDRPKLFKLPTLKQGEDLDDLGGVRGVVLEQCRSFTDMQPKKAREIRPLPKEITFHKPDLTSPKKRDVGTPGGDKPGSRTSGGKLSGGQGNTSPTPHTLVAVPNRDDEFDGRGRGDKPGSRASGGKLSGGQGNTSPTPHTLVAVPNRDDEFDGRSSFSRLGRLAGYEDSPGSGGGGPDSRASKVSSKKSHTASLASKTRTDQTSTPTSKNVQGVKSAASSGSSKAVQQSHGSYPTRRKNKKAEQAAQAAAENIKKHGICMVPIRMAVLFAGIQKVTNRLENPVPGVEDLFVSLQLNKPLLNEDQKRDLNPMIIKIHSATNMPDSPMSYDQLKDRCMPAYCRYSFFKLPPHLTLKRNHSKNVYWDDINVILAGTFEQSEFRQYLNGPPFEIELHDRDRKPEEIKLKATLFGDDLEDEKISNVGTVASRRTLHNPFKDKAKVWDPYGVARLDLSDLLLGHRYLYLKVPVHNCPPPDLLGTGDNKMGGKFVGVAGAVDGPVSGPLASGHYVSSNTMIKVKVELAHSLVTPADVAAKEIVPVTNECPFGRIVFRLDYKNTSLLNQLQSLITKINAQALDLDDMPQHVVDAALSTYKLSGMQQQSRTLDIITGFQILDGTMHMFVLEGLRDKAIKEVWETLPQPENSDVVVLYNSDLTFSERLYGPLDVDLCRVKLHEPLENIVQQPLLYLRDMVPKPCFEALVRLHSMTKVKNVKDAVRTELFPTADMVVSMSKEFGVPFTAQDFEDLTLKEEKSFMAEATTTQDQSVIPDSGRYWEPIDNLNITYMERLAHREEAGQQRDFLKEYKNEVKRASNINKREKEMNKPPTVKADNEVKRASNINKREKEMNKPTVKANNEVKRASNINKREKEMNKPPTVKADVNVAHNYSSQTLNSTELAKEKLRQILAQNPDTRYTYCQDYLHSMTVIPVNVEALKKQEKEESEARWKTEEGWIYPGMQTTLEANVHPKRPHVARSDELKERWRENILHVGLLQAPLDRDRYPWDLRFNDLELYKKPEINFGVPEPLTIHLAGEKLRQEKLAEKRKDLDQWRSKIVVKDTRQYFHRCLTETEFKTGGRNASNQIARLQGLLKDTPQKLALRRSGMRLSSIPPLSVVQNPAVDTESRLQGTLPPSTDLESEERHSGFKPGPFVDHSWVLERNKIPAVDYEHSRFNKTKGHDFNVYHKERAKMWRRPIVPLTDEERDNHLFRIPDTSKFVLELPTTLGPRSLTQPLIPTPPIPKIEKPVSTEKMETEKIVPTPHVTFQETPTPMQAVN